LPNSTPRLLAYSGVLAVVLAWIIIGVSWSLNRDWFSYSKGAFSDLGSKRSCCPEVFNYGLITVGFLFFIYGVSIAYSARTKAGVAGGSYVSLAGFFLALVGVYPEETKPHGCVAVMFFLLAYTGLMLSLLEATRRSRLAVIALAAMALSVVAGLIVGATTGWPSVAILETYLILFIDLGVVALARSYTT
jgi:hypothetical membrane protein